jgi:predicted CXXCH cytochrome family protein
MRDWAGSDGVRGVRSTEAGRTTKGGSTGTIPAGADVATPGGPQGRRSLTRSRVGMSRLALAAMSSLVALILLTAAVPRLRAPRPLGQIQTMLADSPHQGDCDRCHSMHGDGQPDPQVPLLLAPNDNQLCITCHNQPWANGTSWAGAPLYGGTGHGASSSMVWPGPTPPNRTEIDAAGKCLNCHDPHGYSDATGLIPNLGLQREEALCLACHDGSPATTNVLADLQKPYRHPVTDHAGRHTGPTESLPSDFGTSPLNQRHSECVDCHDPHVSRPDRIAPSGSDLSKTTLGASRVTILNGVAGSTPNYTFTSGVDTLAAPTAEYTLCFKCHSSWTTQPSGQTDLAKVLNPSNPSYHPVEGTGRNTNVHPLAFANGWNTFSTTRCGDCHGSDFGTARGPHGSLYRYILKQPYTASADPRTMDSNELCFACHTYDTYANRNAPASVLDYSRFGGEEGHAKHVGEESVPCYACHVTHGSTTLPHLIVLGRNPGIQSYTETAGGGTCAPTCHGSESYSVTYAR